MPHDATLTISEQASAIARLVVRTTAEFTGRGPTKAHAHLHGDVLTVVLRGILTQGERHLVRDGSGDVVLASRKAFQRSMAPLLIEGVEAVTGRKVEAFLSDNHIDPDLAVETFVLRPLGEDAKPGSDDRAPQLPASVS